MYFRNDPAGSRAPSCAVVFDIIDGRPWKARVIRNNNLRQHCHLLARTFRNDPTNNIGLRPAMKALLHAVTQRTRLLETIHPKEFQLIPVLVRIAAYSANWLRDPLEWSGASGTPLTQVRSFVAHLFERYPVPGFFRNAWLVKGTTRYLERDWYCRIAAGGSLQGADGFPPTITARARHLAMGAPDHLTIRQALRWGQAKAAGACDDLVSELLESAMVKDLSNDALWSRLIGKMAAAHGRQAGDFGIVADAMLGYLKEERWRHVERLLQLPYADLVRHCARLWTRHLEQAVEEGLITKQKDIRLAGVRRVLFLNQFSTVEPMIPDARWSKVDGPRNRQREWRMVELTRRSELVTEGHVMRHCVASYWRKCREGKTAIFSLRSHEWPAGTDTRRHLTIEVNRRSRTIRQIRGIKNHYFWYRIRGVMEWAADNRIIYP